MPIRPLSKLVGLLAALWCGIAYGQNFPSRAVKILVPAVAGSSPDIRARQVQFQLHVTFFGIPDIALPAYDSSLRIPHVIKS